MATIAVYSLKGGVGKTTLAVNLAWSSAVQSARRTLLWDLDPQASATFLLNADLATAEEARSVFAKEVPPEKLIRPTAIEQLDLLPADVSLRGLDRLLFTLGKKKRLTRLIEAVAGSYDRIILDCPPGLTETSEQVMRAASLILVPVTPSPLSRRALDEVATYLDRLQYPHAPILPVLSMVDRRRSLHLATLAEQPKWPVIPMASAVEAMSVRRAPVGAFAPRSSAGKAFSALWTGVERRLAKGV